MSMSYRYEVDRKRLDKTRIEEFAIPKIADGELLVEIDLFALTANNVTYGVVGEKIGYWKFFPAEAGWGVIPVWGVGHVTASKHPDIKVGERLYGYFPMGSHLVIKPSKVAETRLLDGSENRRELPPVYNSYARIDHEPGYDRAYDEARSLLFPLYATSYCLYDFLLDNEWFGAEQVAILSASSKTALGLGLALKNDADAPTSIGVTSARNHDWVQGLSIYGSTATYDTLQEIDASNPTVIVDMSGNGAVLSDLHKHLGDSMRYCSNVGVTHYDENRMGPHFIAARSAMFFAPGHIQKRTAEWGPGVFEKKALDFWAKATKQSMSWLKFDRREGVEAMAEAYSEVLSGGSDPSSGIIVRPNA